MTLTSNNSNEATRTNLVDALIAGFESDYKVHPAKTDYNYHSYKDDLYPTRLDEELARLREGDASNLGCLAYISEVSNIERTINETRELLVQLEKEEAALNKRVQAETKQHDELFALRSLLQQRVENIDTQVRTKTPDQVLVDMAVKKKTVGKQNKAMMSELKGLLHDKVAPLLGSDEAELKTTVEALLNEMFDNAEGSTDGGYVKVDNPQSPIVQFLLKSELAFCKPEDSRFLKLREFGRE